ncbi:MAG: DUF975 family protein [Bacilli bacterium]
MVAKDYRHVASEKAKKYTGLLVLICFIYALIVSAVTGINAIGFVPVYTWIATSVSGVLGIFILPPLMLGVHYVSKVTYEGGDLSVGNLFNGFKTNYWKSIGLDLLGGIYLILWGVWSLGIGAIIKSYSYSMATFILEEHPEIGVNEAITKSKEMMHGHKWQLFCMQISYIGWAILVVLTLGILGLWVSPKMAIANYAFYCEVKK